MTHDTDSASSLDAAASEPRADTAASVVDEHAGEHAGAGASSPHPVEDHEAAGVSADGEPVDTPRAHSAGSADKTPAKSPTGALLKAVWWLVACHALLFALSASGLYSYALFTKGNLTIKHRAGKLMFTKPVVLAFVARHKKLTREAQKLLSEYGVDFSGHHVSEEEVPFRSSEAKMLGNNDIFSSDQLPNRNGTDNDGQPAATDNLDLPGFFTGNAFPNMIGSSGSTLNRNLDSTRVTLGSGFFTILPQNGSGLNPLLPKQPPPANRGNDSTLTNDPHSKTSPEMPASKLPVSSKAIGSITSSQMNNFKDAIPTQSGAGTGGTVSQTDLSVLPISSSAPTSTSELRTPVDSASPPTDATIPPTSRNEQVMTGNKVIPINSDQAVNKDQRLASNTEAKEVAHQVTEDQTLAATQGEQHTPTPAELSTPVVSALPTPDATTPPTSQSETALTGDAATPITSDEAVNKDQSLASNTEAKEVARQGTEDQTSAATQEEQHTSTPGKAIPGNVATSPTPANDDKEPGPGVVNLYNPNEAFAANLNRILKAPTITPENLSINIDLKDVDAFLNSFVAHKTRDVLDVLILQDPKKEIVQEQVKFVVEGFQRKCNQAIGLFKERMESMGKSFDKDVRLQKSTLQGEIKKLTVSLNRLQDKIEIERNETESLDQKKLKDLNEMIQRYQTKVENYDRATEVRSLFQLQNDLLNSKSTYETAVSQIAETKSKKETEYTAKIAKAQSDIETKQLKQDEQLAPIIAKYTTQQSIIYAKLSEELKSQATTIETDLSNIKKFASMRL